MYGVVSKSNSEHVLQNSAKVGDLPKLIHYGIVTPYGEIDLVVHWLR